MPSLSKCFVVFHRRSCFGTPDGGKHFTANGVLGESGLHVRGGGKGGGDSLKCFAEYRGTHGECIPVALSTQKIVHGYTIVNIYTSITEKSSCYTICFMLHSTFDALTLLATRFKRLFQGLALSREHSHWSTRGTPSKKR